MTRSSTRAQPAASADEIRATQRDLWDRFAAGWEKWDDVVGSVLGPVGDAMIDSLAIGDTQQHLDVAAGTGEPGLTIATLARHGHVTLTDIAPACSPPPSAGQRRAPSPTSAPMCAAPRPTLR